MLLLFYDCLSRCDCMSFSYFFIPENAIFTSLFSFFNLLLPQLHFRVDVAVLNQLKRDLNAEKFQNIYNIHNNSQTFENNKINIEEEKNNENDNEIQQNYNVNENDNKENNDIDNENSVSGSGISYNIHLSKVPSETGN